MATKPASKNQENSAGKRIPRPPVVVVMGHIDHGKSTLLDHIRKANIVSGEAGGITQHVGAYETEHQGKDGVKHRITFLDTPGHEAFHSIRERGALAADIAILVVSAEDGVKPQTVEALSNIRERGMPYIVAINKIDKPNADADRAKQSLAEHEVYVEGWGGDVPCIPISALNGTGVPELLDMIVLVAEIAELRYDPAAPASGIVVESKLDQRTGISATLIIREGTLRSGVFAVCGRAYAPVRYIEDFAGHKVENLAASQPAIVTGWNEMPSVGETFMTVANKKEATEIAENWKDGKTGKEKPPENATAADQTDSPLSVLPLVIKADTTGSLDGVMHELSKIRHEKARLKIVSHGIGRINENDVKLALGDHGIVIVGFNAEPERKAADLAERSGIAINNFKVIYELSQYVNEVLLSKVPKEFVEETTGAAKILALFGAEKDRQIVGGRVEGGTIATGNEVKITRRGTEIGRGKIREMQEKKLRVQSAAEGHEFGSMIESKTTIAVGDRVEAVTMVEKKP